MTDKPSEPGAIDIAGIIAPVLGVAADAGGSSQTGLASAFNFCRHGQVTLDAEKRSVACATCKKTLDPFNVLLEYARGERRWQDWQAMARAAERELERLKADERKTKARLARAERKDADLARADERRRIADERRNIALLARDTGELCRRIERLALTKERKE